MSDLSVQYQQFTDYYHQYKHKVFSYLFYRSGQNLALAEDLASDVFLKAYERFENYNNDYAFSTWIFTIARNHLIDYFRKKREVMVAEIEISDERNSEDKLKKEMDVETAMEKIRPLIAELPPLQQDCIVMKYLGEMENKEIAEITGESEEKVRQNISRAIKKLKAKSSFFNFMLLVTLYIKLR
jgi:RNA polymerase sigma-70 factor, ECF subfamily